MARFIVRIGDTMPGGPWYLEWSTVVDAPVCRGMSRTEFMDHMREEYRFRGLSGLEERMARVDECGTSAHDYATAAEVLSANRAGDDETELTEQELVEHYCRPTSPE